jgi:Tfp pilus assembly protein PilF
MDLKYSPSKRIILKRPFVSDMPKNIVTGASLYQEAMENKEERNYVRAEKLFRSCLQKDPLYIDAMAGLAEIYYRRMQYDSALYFANNALKLDTYHPGANYFAGITYLATGDLEDAVESLGWAARSPEYRSTAYAWMASTELLMKNIELAEHYATLALDYDRANINALQTLAVLYRKSGQTMLADKYVQTLSSLDPLSHFADFERYLLHNSAEDLSRFTSTITNEMPYQTYLELSLIYYDLGLKDDALAVLDKAPSQPLISLWKAYIKGDASMLGEVADASPAFVFPYRTETAKALQWAMSENNSWKFKYYLALNYGGLYRDEDCMKLMLACGQEPDFGPFYITRADLVASTDPDQQLKDLEMARKISPDDWRAASKLINYYENKHDYKMALSMAEESYRKYGNNSEVGLQYVIALINNNQYAKSLKLLEGMTILPFEGASEGKLIYDQACLFLAMDYIQNRKYSSAIKMIDKSRLWPENLGVGKPYDVDTRIQDYLTVYCLGKMNKPAGTDEMKKAIVSYESGRRYPSFNVILAIKTLQAEGKSAEADKIISSMEDSSSPVKKWIAAAAENDQAAMASLEKQFESNRRFQVIKRVLEVTSK